MIENRAFEARLKADKFFQRITSTFSPETLKKLDLENTTSGQELAILEKIIPKEITDYATGLAQRLRPEDVLQMFGCEKIESSTEIGKIQLAVPTQQTIAALGDRFSGTIPGFFFDWYFLKLQIHYHDAISQMRLSSTSAPLPNNAQVIVSRIEELKNAQRRMQTLDHYGNPYVAPIPGFDPYDVAMDRSRWWFLY